MTILLIDPLSDHRWDEFVNRHPRACTFHTRGWLAALKRTYGYAPVALTTSTASEPLTNAVVFCRVSSWLTGHRLVSLPFTDHCEPLLDVGQDYSEFADWLKSECDRRRFKYVELRPESAELGRGSFTRSESYGFHVLDIRRPVNDVFRGMHKDSIQRRIRRAEREALDYERGRSQKLVNEFYQLMLLTRRRHQVPPQPVCWFQNLVESCGTNVDIRIARKDNRPIAALFSLKHRESVIYKYGCSDEKFHNVGAMPFLFWKLIEDGKNEGAGEIDFGRSDLDNEGLLAFKDKFGTTRKTLTYYRYPEANKKSAVAGWKSAVASRAFSYLPNSALSAVGQLLYKHVG